MQNYTIIHSTGGRIITLQPLKQMEAQLPVTDFIGVHKSYLVNMRKIDAIEKNMVVINKTRIKIGETYQQAFFERLKQR